MLIGYLPVSATDTSSSAQNLELGADEKKVDLKEKKEHKKKKGKGKILIPPNDEDIVLTLDKENPEEEK